MRLYEFTRPSLSVSATVNRLSDGRELTVSAGRLANKTMSAKPIFLTYVSLPFDVRKKPAEWTRAFTRGPLAMLSEMTVMLLRCVGKGSKDGYYGAPAVPCGK